MTPLNSPLAAIDNFPNSKPNLNFSRREKSKNIRGITFQPQNNLILVSEDFNTALSIYYVIKAVPRSNSLLVGRNECVQPDYYS